MDDINVPVRAIAQAAPLCPLVSTELCSCNRSLIVHFFWLSREPLGVRCIPLFSVDCYSRQVFKLVRFKSVTLKSHSEDVILYASRRFCVPRPAPKIPPECSIRSRANCVVKISGIQSRKLRRPLHCGRRETPPTSKLRPLRSLPLDAKRHIHDT